MTLDLGDSRDEFTQDPRREFAFLIATLARYNASEIADYISNGTLILAFRLGGISVTRNIASDTIMTLLIATPTGRTLAKKRSRMKKYTWIGSDILPAVGQRQDKIHAER